jgi:hypothetical protein
LSDAEGVDLDDELRQLAQVRRQFVGDDGPQFDHGIVVTALDPPSPRHDACLVEVEIGCVEEEHLTDLGLERIDAEGARR